MREEPRTRERGPLGERVFATFVRTSARTNGYIVALLILTFSTAVCSKLPVSYHAIGEIYLLVVLGTSLVVDRVPAFCTAIASAILWNCLFIPPRFSLRILNLDDGMLLAIYFLVASVGSFWAVRAREQHKLLAAREREASALLQLTQTLASGNDFQISLLASLEKAAALFETEVLIYFADEKGNLSVPVAREIEPGLNAALIRNLTGENVATFRAQAFRGTAAPMLQNDRVIGWAVVLSRDNISISNSGVVLLRGFAIQLGAMYDREKLRVAAERQHVLDQSNRLHRTLLDAVSHELNTPLSVLQSAAEELPDASETDRLTLIAEIKSGVRRLNRLMTNLISRSRLEADLLQPNFDWCDVRDLFREATESAGDLLLGYDLTTRMPRNMPFIFADSVLMEQVLTNLLVNAARHTPVGSAIVLEARADEVNKRIQLSVRDTGVGVPANLQPHLFDKFRRGRDAAGNGLGLGLSIAHQLTRNQGGQLTYSDNRDGGACFTVEMPLVNAAPVPADE